jgi:hypothetical protein
MEHYVTLFDLRYAPQGIALHRSLLRHAGEHRLWIVCMDDAVESLLTRLALPNVSLIHLGGIETASLLAAKAERSRQEYCWTITPSTFDAVFDRDATVRRVTYVDADLWLRADPGPTFAEFEASGAAVQITEHAFSPEHDLSHRSGKYCVQFLTMVREDSTPVRTWWMDRCAEWCFNRHEDGKFGDQKYLDDWPSRFGHLVHVARDRSWFQAPWNARRFPYSEAIAFHFHGLQTMPGRRVRIASEGWNLPEPHVEHVYQPYLEDLAHAMSLLAAHGVEAEVIQEHAPWQAQRRLLRPLLGQLHRWVIGSVLRVFDRRVLRAPSYLAELPEIRRSATEDE